jgi:hypothetical protein
MNISIKVWHEYETLKSFCCGFICLQLSWFGDWRSEQNMRQVSACSGRLSGPYYSTINSKNAFIYAKEPCLFDEQILPAFGSRRTGQHKSNAMGSPLSSVCDIHLNAEHLLHQLIRAKGYCHPWNDLRVLRNNARIKARQPLLLPYVTEELRHVAMANHGAMLPLELHPPPHQVQWKGSCGRHQARHAPA